MPIFPKGGGGGSLLPNEGTVVKFEESDGKLLWDGKEIAEVLGGTIYEIHTITAPEITAKRFALGHSLDITRPMSLILATPNREALLQVRNLDFTYLTSGNYISWDGLGMTSCAQPGDYVITIYYEE
jgi:hypothetical protein